MAYLAEAARSLWARWLEFFWDVDVTEVVLAAEIVDRQPLHFGDALVVRQLDCEFFVEVALEYVGSKNVKRVS